jgi:redox-sensitive bicupin YhaK (pirin superfamily)
MHACIQKLHILDTSHAGPVDMRHPGLLLDVTIKQGGTFQHSFPSEWNAFAYICDGSGTICGKSASAEHALVLGTGEGVQASTDGVRFYLLCVSLYPEAILCL